MQCRLLVPDEDVLEFVLLEDLVVDVEDCAPGIAEYVLDTFRGKAAHDDLCAGDFHLVPFKVHWRLIGRSPRTLVAWA